MYKSKNLAAKVLSTLLIFITVISLINMEAPAASKTIKIMPVGDSCTEGMVEERWVLTVRNCTDC